MIKGGGSIHAQNVADAYIMNNNQNHPIGKPMKQNMQHNNKFNQSKYISGNASHHNQSQSPASTTFFKDNSQKNKQNSNSLIGKKGWPTLKKKTNNPNQTAQNNQYVSPYSKNPNPKRIPGQQNNMTLQQQNPNAVNESYGAGEGGPIHHNSSAFNNSHNVSVSTTNNNNN